MLEITTTPSCGYCAIGSKQTGRLINVEVLQCAVDLSLMFLYIKYFRRKDHLLLLKHFVLEGEFSRSIMTYNK